VAAMLNQYTRNFSKLKTDRGRARFPTGTNYGAPHKPFLLLSIIDLIAQGRQTEGDGHEIMRFLYRLGHNNFSLKLLKVSCNRKQVWQVDCRISARVFVKIQTFT